MIESKTLRSNNIFNIIAILMAIGLNAWLIYRLVFDLSFIWLTLGSFVFITIPLFYNYYNSGYRIIATENEVIFITKKKLKMNIIKFKYDDITNFKSYLLYRSLGDSITTETYGVFDLEFKKEYKFQIDELSYSNFQELKHHIYSRIKNPS